MTRLKEIRAEYKKLIEYDDEYRKAKAINPRMKGKSAFAWNLACTLVDYRRNKKLIRERRK